MLKLDVHPATVYKHIGYSHMCQLNGLHVRMTCRFSLIWWLVCAVSRRLLRYFSIWPMLVKWYANNRSSVQSMHIASADIDNHRGSFEILWIFFPVLQVCTTQAWHLPVLMCTHPCVTFNNCHWLTFRFVYCYPCIYHYLKENNTCPLTGYPAHIRHLVRLYRTEAA